MATSPLPPTPVTATTDCGVVITAAECNFGQGKKKNVYPRRARPAAAAVRIAATAATGRVTMVRVNRVASTTDNHGRGGSVIYDA